jgi:hypothetical protein
VYDPSLGSPPVQIRDFNPGIESDGLFWTTALDSDDIDVNLGKGFASMEAEDVDVFDFGNFGNALFGGPGTPATVSFAVEWSGVNQRVNVKNTDAPAAGGGFAGEFVRNTAQMDWSASVGNVSYESDPLATSASSFAEIGKERNGVFNP